MTNDKIDWLGRSIDPRPLTSAERLDLWKQWCKERGYSEDEATTHMERYATDHNSIRLLDWKWWMETNEHIERALAMASPNKRCGTKKDNDDKG